MGSMCTPTRSAAARTHAMWLLPMQNILEILARIVGRIRVLPDKSRLLTHKTRHNGPGSERGKCEEQLARRVDALRHVVGNEPLVRRMNLRVRQAEAGDD